MKVAVKKKVQATPLFITTDFIQLQNAMKYANVVFSGGEAKQMIQNGEVMVNGEICTMRGKKLRNGDCFTFHGHTFRIEQKV